MPGYANRTVRIPFPEFTEDGDPEVFVAIRNPKTLPTHLLITRDVSDDDVKRDRNAYLFASYALIASLIVDWNVYDSTSADPQRLELPADEHKVATLPRAISEAIAAKITEALNPGAGA